MRQNASGITLASTSHTIVSLNNRRIFATRSSETSITSDIIPRRLKICSALFFDHHVELIMRAYIVPLQKDAVRATIRQLSPRRDRKVPDQTERQSPPVMRSAVSRKS